MNRFVFVTQKLEGGSTDLDDGLAKRKFGKTQRESWKLENIEKMNRRVFILRDV